MIAVGGCYAEAQRERIFELYPEVDVAFGPGSIAHLADWLGAGGVGVARGRFGLADREFASTLPMHRERPFQAWIQVSMGCNSTCSYCIVPAVRGREQSRRPGDVIAEVTRLAADGVKEITLLGQNVNSWGRDLAAGDPNRVRRAPARLRCGRGDRAHPLHEPASEGLPRAGDRRDHRLRHRLRAHSPAAPVRLVADPESDAAHLHPRALPRRSSTACVRRSPTSLFGTDIIVGFPGETESDFEQTLEVVERLVFDSAFTFVYSPRQGTDARRDGRTRCRTRSKIERMERLVALTQRIATERNAARVGRLEQVLVEGPSRTEPTLLRGRTRRNTTVNFSGAAAAGRARRRADRPRDLDDAARAPGSARPCLAAGHARGHPDLWQGD